MRPFSFVAIMGAIVHSRSVLADDLIGGCSSHCTHFDEESITCWNNTLAFFEEILLGQMRGYVLTEAGIALWKRQHNQLMDWDLAAERTIKDMENMHPPNIEDEHDMTDRATYSTVVKSLLDNSHFIADKYQPQPGKFPDVECPIGCEVGHEIYKSLIIGSGIVSALLFGMIGGLSLFQYRRVKNSVKREAMEAMQAYELNAANRSKKSFKLIEVDI